MIATLGYCLASDTYTTDEKSNITAGFRNITDHINEEQDDLDWYYYKLLGYYDNAEWYANLISSQNYIMKAANKLLAYLDGDATQDDFTSLCQNCGQQTQNLLDALNGVGECDAVDLLY